MSTVAEISEAIEKLGLKEQVELLRVLPQHLKISPDDFDKLHKLIKPHPGEAAWAEIPWLTDLWEARKKAAAEGKPIFVWIAAGEALGCD